MHGMPSPAQDRLQVSSAIRCSTEAGTPPPPFKFMGATVPGFVTVDQLQGWKSSSLPCTWTWRQSTRKWNLTFKMSWFQRKKTNRKYPPRCWAALLQLDHVSSARRRHWFLEHRACMASCQILLSSLTFSCQPLWAVETWWSFFVISDSLRP